MNPIYERLGKKENAIEYGFSLVPFDKKEDYKYLIRQY